MTALTSQPACAPPAGDAEVPSEPIYRLSVAQYHAIARAGILDEDAPVELLEGWLVQTMTKNPAHCLSLGLVQDALTRLLPRGWHLKIQAPMTTADSEPEPDAAVVRGQRRDYKGRHPRAEDIALVVEVADTSLRRDRGSKKRIYARAGIPVYWIANLPARCFEICTAPTGPAKRPGYGQRQEYGPVEEIPVLLDGKEIGRLKVGDLLP